MLDEVNIAAIQTKICNTKEKTIMLVKKQIEKASKIGADIVCLPERWNMTTGNIEDDPETLNGMSNNSLRSFAEEYGIYIIGGAIWQKKEDKLIITSSLFDNKGERIGLQQKQHLYLFEREFFDPGGELQIFKTKIGNLGILICFDMTFPEVPRKLVLEGAEILFTPVMIREEGIENWHSYLKTRALENRIPVIGVNIVGESSKKKFPGKSAIIDFKKGYVSPSKLEIYIGKKNEPDMLFKKIDLKYSKKLRKIRLNQRTKYDNHILRGK
ncbi:MAG: hypothetical protein GF329_14070 [Candidatus Lokiarchaeota archaeon]|nr:hypothetical protein [Candidatus Lokiarchaeota archaeon]